MTALQAQVSTEQPHCDFSIQKSTIATLSRRQTYVVDVIDNVDVLLHFSSSLIVT